MIHLPNDLLIESYIKAKTIKLQPEFIKMLENEMRRRFLLTDATLQTRTSDLDYIHFQSIQSSQ
ncbi:sporulation histidine kinase inhibitor Sda [Sporosarcina sp. 179-K 3D1 HS]|uniref:sporulation histidine kinase inhibitor Sda n=1 Tax=Sporosarcina sp. 179-K 3D1 HS TaxID=3232169 RepID=UPI0039A32990